ncbi:MAG: glutaredoxin 3 [Spongiibacteraceae bacterium]|nr:glutaredoxin 3 [Spongiibacteraceae bacterium]
MAAVTIYSSDWCGFCRRAKSLLQARQADITEINVDGDPAARREMEQRSGRRTVPQIWIGEQHIGGCDDLYALERSGKLDAMLAAE